MNFTAEPAVPPPSFTVRPGRAGDRDAVWPLARALATSRVPTREAFNETFDGLLDAPDRLLLVAETAEPPETGAPGEPAIVGYALAFAHRAFHSDGPVVWLEEIVVGPASRALGAGRSLMAAAEAWARDPIGAAYLALATRRAAPFYRALGYQGSATYYKRDLAGR
ncbi:GNAT family N-acetyltransferase [Rugosimonospora acidiphila]|uniref:GNAT family N-acetyltransferase n=1 Tax=Rugosimonospora acidiphila TaxID=556531 RepID=A0ABP9RZM2_9ACTN